MDIRDAHGVQTNKLPGSRVEYNPFPGGFKIIPGSVISTFLSNIIDSPLC